MYLNLENCFVILQCSKQNWDLDDDFIMLYDINAIITLNMKNVWIL